VEQEFQYSRNCSSRSQHTFPLGEFTVAASNPTGDTVILGNWSSFFAYCFKTRNRSWNEIAPTYVQNLHAVTAIGWKGDGARLAIGSLFGSVDLYDACIRRYQYKGKFELTYASLSQVIVKRLETGTRIVLKSLHGSEISKVNIFQNQYVVANTVDFASSTETLLVGDFSTFKLSEINWSNGGGEKYLFESPFCCIVYHASELTMVEYGSNTALGTVRTDFISSHLISLRITGPSAERRWDPDLIVAVSKKMAYLLDSQTICIKDFISGGTIAVQHTVAVDWLELNMRSNMLLFRDKHRRLHLHDLETQVRTTMLNYSTYVQWVPDCDVIVAQSRHQLCVWYNTQALSQVTVHEISGDIEDIERAPGRTEVIVDEKLSTVSYLLDEALIEFGKMVDRGLLSEATNILESLELSSEAEGMWGRLADGALTAKNFQIAERCAAALVNASRARFLRKLPKLASRSTAETSSCSFHTQISLLEKETAKAEAWLVSQGKAAEAATMYRTLRNFKRANFIMETKAPSLALSLRQDLVRNFLSSHQASRAADLKETEGAYKEAAAFFLKDGMPGRAARVVRNHHISNPVLVNQVAATLSLAGLHEGAGDLHERMNQMQCAMDSYVKGCSFRKAVELARLHFPARVVELQEAWGDDLCLQNHHDMAINHYIEASLSTKAVEAALKSRQWERAAQMLRSIDKLVATPYLHELASQLHNAGVLQQAAQCYLTAGAPEKAVEMYTREKMWEQAHGLASKYMEASDISQLAVTHAQQLESEGKLSDAEKMYLNAKEPDLAINMHKKQRNYDSMVRLVEIHRPELLKEMHQHLAEHLEKESRLSAAEDHYCKAGEWLSAVNMYRSNDLWRDAMRVASLYGGQSASKRVAYAWAMYLGGEAGANMLTKQGLIEPAIEYATESNAFDHAFELARMACPNQLRNVHLKHALHLEDEERYKEAEVEFIRASKPREAIDMYVHQQAWHDAIEVATKHDPSAMLEVHFAHARAEAGARHYQHAEELFLLAGKPEHALAMYREAGLVQKATAFARQHVPHKLTDLMGDPEEVDNPGTLQSKEHILATAQRYERERLWDRAVETYLKPDVSSMECADLADFWHSAVSLSRRKLPSHRYRSIVQDVVCRLSTIGCHESAAELLRELGDQTKAVQCAIDGRCWTKARELALGSTSLGGLVESAHQSGLKQNADVDSMSPDVRLDVLAERHQWDRLWLSVDQSHVDSILLAKYAGLNAAHSIEHDEYGAAVAILKTRGLPPVSSNYALYETLVTGILTQHGKTEGLYGELKKVLKTLNTSSKRGEHAKELEAMLMATHYMGVYLGCVQAGLFGLAVKVAVSLLRFPSLLPVDKTTYIAGVAARKQGYRNFAFVLLNRYIDIAEAIDDGIGSIDSSDFAESSLTLAFDVPKKHSVVREEDREEVRDWVLSTCMDTDVEQRLPSKQAATGTIYAGLYSYELPSCVVTGYPVQPWEAITVSNQVANKVDYNHYVRATKKCPWTNETQSPLY